MPPAQEETLHAGGLAQQVHPPGPPRRGGERPYRGDHPGHGGLCQNHPSALSPLRHDRHDLPQRGTPWSSPPGQKIQKAPPPQPVPQRSGEPVGEPIETPRGQTSTGYTMQIGGLDAVPVDSTQDFMAAYNAVRPQRRPASAPVQPATPVQTPPAADA